MAWCAMSSIADSLLMTSLSMWWLSKLIQSTTERDQQLSLLYLQAEQVLKPNASHLQKCCRGLAGIRDKDDHAWPFHSELHSIVRKKIQQRTGLYDMNDLQYIILVPQKMSSGEYKLQMLYDNDRGISITNLTDKKRGAQKALLRYR